MNKIETMLDTLVIRYGDRSYSEKTHQLYLEARKDILDEFDRLRTDSILLTRDIALRDLTIAQRDERIAMLVELLDEARWDVEQSMEYFAYYRYTDAEKEQRELLEKIDAVCKEHKP